MIQRRNKKTGKRRMQTSVHIEKKQGFYAVYIKRTLDFILSTIALVLLSPLLAGLILGGSIAMRGNPFLYKKDREKMKKYLNLSNSALCQTEKIRMEICCPMKCD